jgi:hypothetical protein
MLGQRFLMMSLRKPGECMLATCALRFVGACCYEIYGTEGIERAYSRTRVLKKKPLCISYLRVQSLQRQSDGGQAMQVPGSP